MATDKTAEDKTAAAKKAADKLAAEKETKAAERAAAKDEQNAAKNAEPDTENTEPTTEAVDEKLKEIRPPAGDIPQEAKDLMPENTVHDQLDNPEVIESGLDVEGRKSPLPTLPENHAYSAAAAVAAQETGTQTQDEVNHARKMARLEAEQAATD